MNSEGKIQIKHFLTEGTACSLCQQVPMQHYKVADTQTHTHTHCASRHLSTNLIQRQESTDGQTDAVLIAKVHFPPEQLSFQSAPPAERVAAATL